MIFLEKMQNRDKIVFRGLLILNLVYVLPIIIANRYYNDDLPRSLYGATRWNGDGRPLVEVIIKILCMNTTINSIAPLPLILGVLFFSYVLSMYIKQYFGETYHDYIKILGSFFVIANPFMLANLSYHYDSV